MASEYTFLANRICPICGQEIQVTKTKSRLVKTKQDDDFCAYYKDFNPMYYYIWVCSSCGYASDEAHFDKLLDREKNKIAEFLATQKANIKHHEERTAKEAIASFKLAIYYAGLIDAKPSRMAGLYLKLAWVYRSIENKAEENKLLQFAVDAYDKSLSTERYPIGPMTDTMVTYLIGALYKRLGNREKATQYLSRVIGDRRARMEPDIFNRARDMWQGMREEDAQKAE